ncbi:acyltransferase family protein [Emticicia sp. 17c]|uniref:acyltransferase family protein n=1 Tax=Emticicia sp. 17c TaxID=3127704 RepID=UPI00301E05EF
MFVFNGLFALIYPFIKKLSTKAVALTAVMKHKPMVFFIVLFMLTWLLYVPLAYAVGAGTWTGAGPFDFQLSRILLYAGYFMFGAFIGLTPFNQELFSTDSKLVNTWLVWVILALAIYVFLTVIEKQAILATMVAQKQLAPFAAWMIYFSIYVSSCVCSCIAFLTTFRKLVHKSYSWWNSLSANAYLIYLTHYVFVIWTQFWLLPYELPAFMKFLISFSVSLALSWGLSILLRKNRLIHKYL